MFEEATEPSPQLRPRGPGHQGCAGSDWRSELCCSCPWLLCVSWTYDGFVDPLSQPCRQPGGPCWERLLSRWFRLELSLRGYLL